MLSANNNILLSEDVVVNTKTTNRNLGRDECEVIRTAVYYWPMDEKHYSTFSKGE